MQVRKPTRLVRTGAIVTIGLVLAGAAATADTGKPTVYVVNYPLQYFAERIGEDTIEVVFPVPPTVDPALWHPEPEAVAGFQQADLVLVNGAGYAKWLDKVSLRASRLVDTSSAFEERTIEVPGAVTHGHGPDGAHSHAGTASHTWLDLSLAGLQARAVARALTDLLPEEARRYRANAAALKHELWELDKRLKALSARDPGLALVASHPVYQYLARRYALDLTSVVWEPGSVPDSAAWRAFETQLKERPTRWMIWEATPDPETVRRLEALGVGSIVYDPAARGSAQGDFLQRMERNVENLGAAFPPGT